MVNVDPCVVDAQLLPLLHGAPTAAAIGTVIVIGESDVTEGSTAYEEFLSAHEPMELPDVSEESTALIMYTSGTTGRCSTPTNARVPHPRATRRRARWPRVFPAL